MRNWLKQLRRASGNMTQEELGRLAGISRTMITEIENGKANPSPKVAKNIAAVLDFDWTRFYDDEPQSRHFDEIGAGTGKCL